MYTFFQLTSFGNQKPGSQFSFSLNSCKDNHFLIIRLFKVDKNKKACKNAGF